MANFPLVEPGVWLEQRRPARGERALLCDRDGIVIVDRGYLADPDGVVLIDGICDIFNAAEHHGVPIAIVTNQSGVGRGYYDWSAFAAVQQRMLDLLAADGISPSIVIACAYHEDAQEPYRRVDAPMRKPNPGMLLDAVRMLGSTASRSLMIGDKRDDMTAAARATLQAGVLVGDQGLDDPTPSAWRGTEIGLTSCVREAASLVGQWLEGTWPRQSTHTDWAPEPKRSSLSRRRLKKGREHGRQPV